MKRIAIFIGLSLIFACLQKPAPPAGKGAAKDIPQALDQAIDDARALQKALAGRKSLPQAQALADSLRKNLEALRTAKPPKGDPDLFQQYNEASLGILTDLQAHLHRSHWPAAQESWSRLNPMLKDMVNSFTPSLWERLKQPF